MSCLSALGYQIDWDAVPDWISGVGTALAAGVAVLVYYWQRRDAIADRRRATLETERIGTFALTQEALALQIFAEVWAHRFAKLNVDHADLARACQRELDRDRARDLQSVLSKAPALLSMQYIGVLNIRAQLATAIDQMVLFNSGDPSLALDASKRMHLELKALIAACLMISARFESDPKKGP